MNSKSIALIALLHWAFLPYELAAQTTNGPTPNSSGQLSAVAQQLLDSKKSNADREKILAQFSGDPGALLAAMVGDLEPGTPEEYQRIPWIWRVAIAAGKRNQAAEIKSILNVALPKPGEPLRDWQSVVIGGGVINGISQTGPWPGDRLNEILKGEKELKSRWQHLPELASTMADNEQVKTGTRYDALRILGVESWTRSGAQLSKYLAKEVHGELQQGAISGLNDVKAKEVGPALIAAMENFSVHNRGLALDALLRDETRISALLDAVEAGRLKASDLGAARIDILRKSANKKLRARAAKLFL